MNLAICPNDLQIRPNESFICSNDSFIRSNDLLIRPNDSFICSNDSFICSNDLLIRPNEEIFFYLASLRRRNLQIRVSNLLFYYRRSQSPFFDFQKSLKLHMTKSVLKQLYILQFRFTCRSKSLNLTENFKDLFKLRKKKCEKKIL